MKLYENINSRVDYIIRGGLIQEAENLKPYRHLNAINTAGYSEIFDYFDGKYSENEAIEKIKQNTTQLAKRQLTWFHKSDDIKWFEQTQLDEIISYFIPLLDDHEHAEQKN